MTAEAVAAVTGSFFDQQFQEQGGWTGAQKNGTKISFKRQH